jgi:thiamine biosynthesis lipoprotein
MLASTFETMGTVVSLRLRTTALEYEAMRRLRNVFEEYDARFSLYTSDSELSRVADGQLTLAHSSVELRETYAACIQWRSATNGDFTPHRPDGVIDLSGIVKALAMNDAATHLDTLSPQGWLLDVGGDILSRGNNEPWRVGIVDPHIRGELLCSVTSSPQWAAVATSGTAERGDHIWRTDPSAAFVHVTVLAADIVTADVLATAILAGGRAGLDRAVRSHPIDVITVDRAGRMLVTPRLRAMISL